MPDGPPTDPSRRRFLESSVAALLAAGAATAASGPGEAEPKDAAASSREWVAYCGLYCGLCSNQGKLKQLAGELLATLAADETQEAPEVRRRLEELRDTPPQKCCRTGQCGHPRCAIRKCAKRKGVFVCPECDQFPCDKVKTLAVSEPTLIHDGERLRKVGLSAWIEEQEKRREAGFCYSDVRCGHCTVPTE